MNQKSLKDFNEPRNVESLLFKPGEKLLREAVSQELLARAQYYREMGDQITNRGHIKRAIRLERYAERLLQCRKSLYYRQCVDCFQWFISPGRCELRICPSCSAKYAFQVKQAMEQLVRGIPNKGTKRWMMLTLTKKVGSGCEPINSDVKRLFKQARKLINRFYPGKEGCGAFGVFEMGGSRNLHIHAIVYGEFVSQRQISTLWEELTGNSKIVDIRLCRSPEDAVEYILKYVFKPQKSDDPKDIALYLDLLTGVRRIHRFGILYNCKIKSETERLCCPYCGGKLAFVRCEASLDVPAYTLFYGEALKAIAA